MDNKISDRITTNEKKKNEENMYEDK